MGHWIGLANPSKGVTICRNLFIFIWFQGDVMSYCLSSQSGPTRYHGNLKFIKRRTVNADGT